MIRQWRGWGVPWRYHGGMTKFQQKKSEALQADGLSPEQAKEFIWYNFTHAYMRRFRAGVRRGLAGVTRESAWAWFRKVYDEAIAKGREGKRGGYKPPKRIYDPNKPHKKQLPMGGTDKEYTSSYEQKRRASKKELEKRGVTSIYRDTDGNIIGGVRYNPKTKRYEEWIP